MECMLRGGEGGVDKTSSFVVRFVIFGKMGKINPTEMKRRLLQFFNPNPNPNLPSGKRSFEQ